MSYIGAYKCAPCVSAENLIPRSVSTSVAVTDDKQKKNLKDSGVAVDAPGDDDDGDANPSPRKETRSTKNVNTTATPVGDDDDVDATQPEKKRTKHSAAAATKS